MLETSTSSRWRIRAFGLPAVFAIAVLLVQPLAAPTSEGTYLVAARVFTSRRVSVTVLMLGERRFHA